MLGLKSLAGNSNYWLRWAHGRSRLVFDPRAVRRPRQRRPTERLSAGRICSLCGSVMAGLVGPQLRNAKKPLEIYPDGGSLAWMWPLVLFDGCLPVREVTGLAFCRHLVRVINPFCLNESEPARGEKTRCWRLEDKEIKGKSWLVFNGFIQNITWEESSPSCLIVGVWC